jgi:rubrerythrin
MIKEYIEKIVDNGKQEDMKELSNILEEVIYIVKESDEEKFDEYKNTLEKMSKEDKEMYNMRNYDNRTEYHGGEYRENYRDDGYRDEDYREDYRNDYRGDYRDNYRRNYDRRGGRINRRSYREDDVYGEIENAMYEAKECHRKMEDLAEMIDDPKIKNTLMKIAMREKEHYSSLKELLEK